MPDPQSYLVFRVEPAAGRLTSLVDVVSRRSGDLLGVIAWYSRWRQYVFESKPLTVWSTGCLAEVQAEIDRLNQEQRASAARRKAGVADA